MPRRLPFVLALALALTACAAGDDPSAPEQVAAPPAPDEAAGAADAEAVDADAETDGEAEVVADAAEAAPPARASEALWWTADTVAGGELVGADLAGQNVVLWLWAPWCSVCNREAPEVAEVLADLPDDVTLVGVAGRDDVGPMREFVAEHGLGAMTHVVDADGSVWASYGVSYQPAWVFVDEAGEVSVAAGSLGYDGVFEAIDEVFRG